MSVLQDLQTRAAASPACIVLSEGHDPRIVAAAIAAVDAGIAKIILVGPTDEITKQLSDAGRTPNEDIRIEDPATSSFTTAVAQGYFELRKSKGISEKTALKQAQDPLVFSAMLVRHGHADGTIGGAVATTTKIMRAALHIIGKAETAPLVSSFFLMILPEGHPSERSAMIYSDCGLIIDPKAEELAAIAQQSAASCKALIGETPKVAMLSFSTLGSARHAKVSKVVKATALVKAQSPDLNVDGELQFDAAFVPSVGESKAPDSSVAGHANVMVFPNLDAGNIGYKITQRIGGATAIGPILQGLAKPANDLSRGCVTQDVLNMITITALQASPN